MCWGIGAEASLCLLADFTIQQPDKRLGGDEAGPGVIELGGRFGCLNLFESVTLGVKLSDSFKSGGEHAVVFTDGLGVGHRPVTGDNNRVFVTPL